MTTRTIPEPAWRIRLSTPADIEPLADLWVESWRETLPGIDFAARRPWIVGWLGEGGHVTLVAEHDGLAGFVSTAGRELHQLAVAQARKGSGVARALLDAAKARAPDGFDLDVNSDNPRAIRFYLREGFRVVGQGSNAASGLPTLRMTWPGAGPRAAKRDDS